MSICAPAFVSAAPRVQLVNAFAEPFDNAIATARTCYSSRVITPADVRKDERARALRDSIAQSTYTAGHHTTLQHATFQFVLENVSRQCVWSFLHGHPNYNSEQVSQRYVAVKAERFLQPQLHTPQAQQLYVDTTTAQMQAYAQLVELLREPAAEAYFAIFPARRKHADKYASAIKKKAQEVARYVLPLATHAHLYHTISGLTLHRYHRMMQQGDVPAESALVVSAMVAAVNAHDPLFFANIEDPLPLEQTHEYRLLAQLSLPDASGDARRLQQRFDAQLQGKSAALLDYSARGEQVMAESVRTVLALAPEQLSDDAAIAAVMQPGQNPYLQEALNLNSIGKLSRCMVHPHYTFAKKLSHAADSQDQRHRMTPGTRPLLHRHYAGGSADVIVPGLIAQNAEPLAVFMRSVQRTTDAIDALLDAGVGHEQALYLLPNATPIRFVESGDLLGWHHKWVSRLCYNAQEEIWRASIDEVDAVAQVHPRIARTLLPPCGLRALAGARPLCPEGPRYCGVPVWKLGREQYARVL